MNTLSQHIQKQPIFFVTRDIERAMGIPLETEGFFIIANFSAFSSKLATGKNNVLLINEDQILDTRELLQHSEVKKWIEEKNFDEKKVVVFKNTQQIERICRENNWTLLNPSAELASKIEEKISQVAWLEKLQKYLPKTDILNCKDAVWNGEKFILQFNRAHTGGGTHLIDDEAELDGLKEQFPNRPVRTSEYIDGPTFTLTSVVTQDEVLTGNISYQITGLEPFTDLKFATIGNDWGVVADILSENQIEKIHDMALEIGKKMQSEGWKGLFGIDVVVDEKKKDVYLIEINARQPASTSYESQLQNDKQRTMNKELSLFEAHILSLLEENLDIDELPIIGNGAQIVQRVTEYIDRFEEPTFKNPVDFNVMVYKNTKRESDLVRIQTPYSLMKAHNVLNEKGRMMIDFVLVTKYGKMWNEDRAGIIAIKDEKILLMKRHKYGKDYYCLPGGTPEGDETLKETAAREGKEETNLDFTIPEQEPVHFHIHGRDEYYYFVEDISGDANIIGEELEISSDKNSYGLQWVEATELFTINLLPPEIIEVIAKREKNI